MAWVDNPTLWQTVRNHYLYRNVSNAIRTVMSDRLTLICGVYLLVLIVLAIIGPQITPYGYDEYVRSAEGAVLIGEGPSFSHPLGTNDRGHDVFSRIVYGARPTVITGLVGGFLIMTLGTLIGVTAGYVGGQVDEVLMRFTDMVYGTPVIPFILVLFALFELGFLGIIVVIGLVLWRGAARVIRSQTLQIKERPFIRSAQAYGASTPRIIVKHILPNIAPMAVLYMALGVGWTILVQAGLAFIGVSDPFVPSWGIIIRNAFFSGQLATMWWWSIPPGLLISVTVAATFMMGRSLEQTSGQQLELGY